MLRVMQEFSYFGALVGARLLPQSHVGKQQRSGSEIMGVYAYAGLMALLGAECRVVSAVHDFRP